MNFNIEKYNKVIKLADFITSSVDPKMKWMWGEALLGYALSELDNENKEEKYLKFLSDYCDYWVCRMRYRRKYAPYDSRRTRYDSC